MDIADKIVATASISRRHGFVTATARPEKLGYQLLWCDMGDGLDEADAMECLRAEVRFAVEVLGEHGCVPIKPVENPAEEKP